MNRGVVVKTVIHTMTFNGATDDPIAMAVRDALIAFMVATAQAQAEATRWRRRRASRRQRNATMSIVVANLRSPQRQWILR